jgi:thiol-disulfide isomerase/thioredoxin
MKNILILLLFWGPLSINAQKVDFGTDLKKAMKQAAKEKKLIFIDFYTDWCKPCKMMDADVFQGGEIADRMNGFFINLKINAEFDKYTASQYSINSYPTSLLVDSTGKVVHRSSGYGGIVPFWKKLEPALATTEKGGYFIILKAEYERGRRDAELLKAYCRIRQMMDISNESILDNLIETMPADSQTVYAPVFIQAVRTFGGKGFNYLVEHKAEKRFMNKLKAVVQLNYQNALVEKDKNKLAKVLAANTLIFEDPSVSEAENVVLASGFYWQIKSYDNFHETILTYLKRIPTDRATDTTTRHQSLFIEKTIAFSDFYFNNIKNKRQLMALNNQLDVVEKSFENAAIMTAHAKILYRLEQNERAIALLEKAMALTPDKADLADVLQKIKDKKL